jgi:signal transduction histidine kinase
MPKMLDKSKTRNHKKMTTQNNQEMLSFLTHSLNNILGSAPETVRQTIHLISRGGDYEKNTAQYKAINNMSSLFNRFSLVDALIKTVKLSIADPNELESSWHQDNQGEAHIELVLAFALRQTVSRILFSPADELKKRLPAGTQFNIKTLRQSFMNEVMALELDNNNVEPVFQWLRQNLNLFSWHLEKTTAIHFKKNGIKFTFLLSILSELIYNALKYSNGNRQIEIFWQPTENHYEFICRNLFDPDRRYEGDSTRKGLVFIEKLMNRLKDSTIEHSEENNLFTVKLSFHKSNFEENSHANLVN